MLLRKTLSSELGYNDGIVTGRSRPELNILLARYLWLKIAIFSGSELRKWLCFGGRLTRVAVAQSGGEIRFWASLAYELLRRYDAYGTRSSFDARRLIETFEQRTNVTTQLSDARKLVQVPGHQRIRVYVMVMHWLNWLNVAMYWLINKSRLLNDCEASTEAFERIIAPLIPARCLNLFWWTSEGTNWIL